MTELLFPPKTLRGRLALWTGCAMLASLGLFGAVAVVIATDEEGAEARAESLDEVASDARTQVLTTLALSAPLGVVLAVVGALLISHRVMRPIDEVIHAAAGMTADKLDRRLPAPGTSDELAALVEALNGLFARLERGYADQASFAANASHELRTPLTVIMTELEVALARPRTEDDWRRSATVALHETRKASRVVDALLRHARAALSPGAGIVDLRQLLARVTEDHAQQAASGGLELSSVLPTDPHPVASPGDEDALGAAIGSVLANALRYTPRGGRVSAQLEETATGSRLIHVDDTGPGVSEVEREAIFLPFARGTEGKKVDATRSEGGIGLGLSLARSIADAHGVSLTVAPSPLGGARFTFTFPPELGASSEEPPRGDSAQSARSV